jgi:hypothetical protein
VGAWLLGGVEAVTWEEALVTYGGLLLGSFVVGFAAAYLFTVFRQAAEKI